MGISVDSRRVWDVIQVGDWPVCIVASAVRRERTGVHARIAISIGEDPDTARVLAYDVVNVERDRDRVHLANSAHRALPAAPRKEIPAEVLRRIVDDFGPQIWPAWLQGIEVAECEGLPEGTPAKWLLEPWILEGGGTIMYAPPGVGKSYTALLMAVSLDAGLERTPMGRVHRPGPVLYVNLERNADSLRVRLARVNEALGLPARRPLLMLNARGMTLSDVADRVAQVVEDRDIALVVIDSLSRAGLGSLLEDDTVNRLMDTLNGWGVSWLALAHTAKADRDRPEKQSAFGSQMQDAAADIMVRLASVREPSASEIALSLEITKANDVATGRPLYIVYEFKPDYGLVRVRRAEREELATVASYTGKVADAIVAVLASGAMTVQQITQAIGKDHESKADLGVVRKTLWRLSRRGIVEQLGREHGETLWGLSDAAHRTAERPPVVTSPAPPAPPPPTGGRDSLDDDQIPFE